MQINIQHGYKLILKQQEGHLMYSFKAFLHYFKINTQINSQ